MEKKTIEVKRKAGMSFKVVLFALGIVALVLGSFVFKGPLYISTQFKETLGIVLKNSVDIKHEIRRSRKTTIVKYCPIVLYQYQVGNLTYTHDAIRDPEVAGYPTREAVDKFLKKYPVGSPCTVFYDPKDPRKSVLCKTDLSAAYRILMILLIAVVGGTVFYRLKKIVRMARGGKPK